MNCSIYFLHKTQDIMPFFFFYNNNIVFYFVFFYIIKKNLNLVHFKNHSFILSCFCIILNPPVKKRRNKIQASVRKNELITSKLVHLNIKAAWFFRWLKWQNMAIACSLPPLFQDAATEIFRIKKSPIWVKSLCHNLSSRCSQNVWMV